MPQRSLWFRRWARLSLLIAALLQFAGAAAGPLVHSHDRSWSPVASLSDYSDGPSDTGASHDELHCVVCQALNAVGLPATDATPPELLHMAAAPGDGADRVHASVRSALTRARAPPAI